mmetsp:Transcript_57005/g.102433  ORF Transcript_57005/g.102433 Transcript_57005/m.102433 type:complete len:351 (+) Transcript_57005:61-1113(+)
MSSPSRSEKGNEVAEVLRQEIINLKTKLREAVKTQESLREQLVPIEKLKHEWRNEKQLREKSEGQVNSLEGKIRQLTTRVDSLVEELREQQAETAKYENRCLEFEKVCAELGQQERGAQALLLRAQEREQLSRVDAFESTLRAKRAEELRQEAIAKTHSKEQQLCALKADLKVIGSHAADKRDELFHTSVAANALEKEHSVLRKEHAKLAEDFRCQHEALQDTLAELGTLKERNERLEADLHAKETRLVAQVPHPNEIFASHTQPDRPEKKTALLLPLQPLLPAQHDSTLAFRSSLDDKDLPGLADYLQRQVSRLKSRRDYPRCAAARQLRGRILKSDRGPLFEDQNQSE